MGILDDITGKAEGILGQGNQNPGIMKGIMHLLTDREGGGLHGIISSFKQNGLEDIISSWIGKGENQPVSPAQLREGLGDSRIQKVAEQAGVSNDEAATQLSEHLPRVVDQLTPQGTVPDQGALQQGLNFLKSKL